MTEHEVNEAPKRKRGRPKKVKDLREPVREAMRDDTSFAYRPEDSDDRLRVPKELIPDGMDYLWVTGSVLGQAQPQRLARFQKQGWVPVQAERHDGLYMPRGYRGQIEIDGLILHERSLKISDMARNYEKNKARAQVRAKEVQLLGGAIEGVSLDSQHPSAVGSNKINKSYERIEIPED